MLKLGRIILRGATVVVLTLGLNVVSLAQGTRPTQLLVPYPAGNTFDLVARYIQPELAKRLDRTVIVENIAGAGGSIAAQRLLGLDESLLPMIVASPNELALPPFTNKSVRYSSKDFRLVAHLSSGALAILASRTLPAKDVRELIELARKPGTPTLSYASTGHGSIFHMVGADFAKRLGIQMLHVPYRGGAPAIQDLIGGEVQLAFFPITPSYLQMVESGKMKILGILAPDRNSVLPQVPSASEIPELQGFYYTMWTGLFVSAKLPADGARRIGEAANEIVASQAFRDWVAQRGNSAGKPMTLEEATRFFEAESARFEAIARDIRIERE